MNKAQHKLSVLKAFLQFTRRFVSFETGTFVTLGGEGMEARLWKECSIPETNGYLIERSRSSSVRLIRSNLGYRCTNSLSRFAKTLRVLRGSAASIDALHLDFCGTIEGSFNEASPLIPLVAASSGRCLAITTFEQRRNLSLLKPERTRAEFDALVGERMAQHCIRTLTREQNTLPRNSNLPSFMVGAKPLNGVLREVGMFINVLRLLRSSTAVPDAIERYIFISRYSGRPFRMRTYFFHLQRKVSGASERDHRGLMRLWLASPLHILMHTPAPVPVLEERMIDPYQNLKRLAEAAGGRALAELTELLIRERTLVEQQTDRNAAASKIAEIFRKASQEAFGGLASNGVPERTTVSASGEKPRSKRRSKHVDTLLVQIELLAARAHKHPKAALAGAYLNAYSKLRLTGKNRKRTVGALLARTQGKFRASFVKRALGACKSHQERSELLENLTKHYSAIEGKQINLKSLQS